MALNVVCNDIVFAFTRYEYKSYTDYKDLVRLTGFETCYVDQVDVNRDCVYIVSPFNGEWEPHLYQEIEDHGWQRTAKLIWWCLERPGGSGGIHNFVSDIRRKLDRWLFDIAWLSDRYMVDMCHDDRVQHTILGSHVNLGTLERKETKYDFAHMSYVHANRGWIHEELDKEKITLAPNAWGTERDDLLRRSKFMLATHQDDSPMIEPLRLALASSYGLPILLEYCEDAYPYTRGDPEHFVAMAERADIASKARSMVDDDYAKWDAMGKRCHHLMTGEFSFDRMVIRAVEDFLKEPDKRGVIIE